MAAAAARREPGCARRGRGSSAACQVGAELPELRRREGRGAVPETVLGLPRDPCPGHRGQAPERPPAPAALLPGPLLQSSPACLQTSPPQRGLGSVILLKEGGPSFSFFQERRGDFPLRSFAPSHPASQPAVPWEKLHQNCRQGYLLRSFLLFFSVTLMLSIVHG